MKKLYKSKTDKKLDGVCAGVAKYLDMDPTVIRAAWAVVTLITAGVGIIGYIVCALILPVEPDCIEPEETDCVEQEETD